MAAGAVVTNDVEPWMVVGGNPAKVIRRRELSAFVVPISFRTEILVLRMV